MVRQEMKKAVLTFLAAFAAIFIAQGQNLIGYYCQEFFSGKAPDNRGVYTVRTPAHKKGAVLIRLHGSTAIERIYIVVERQDLSAFINAMESARIQFLKKEHIDTSYFPPVSIMWRDRHKHIWLEGGGYEIHPSVKFHLGKSYLAITGDTHCNLLPELHSGNYYMMLRNSREVEELLKLLRSDKIRWNLASEKMTIRPFEERRDY